MSKIKFSTTFTQSCGKSANRKTTAQTDFCLSFVKKIDDKISNKPFKKFFFLRKNNLRTIVNIFHIIFRRAENIKFFVYFWLLEFCKLGFVRHQKLLIEHSNVFCIWFAQIDVWETFQWISRWLQLKQKLIDFWNIVKWFSC